jgi:hypothetical protein
MDEKRDARRIPLMVRVEAMWQDDTGTLRIVPGVLEDRSLGGVSVRVNSPIRAGASVELRGQYEQFTGVVTYCRREGVVYIVGVQRTVHYPEPLSPEDQ